MPYYLFELRDSDGNDCTVYDIIAEAPDKDAALTATWDAIIADYPDDEEDGGYGTFHPCDCECEHGSTYEDCGEDGCDASLSECSHGGLLLNDGPDAIADTYAEIIAAHARYHCLIDLTTETAR